MGGKLRCNACSENLSDKKSSIKRHTKYKKHEAGLANIARNKAESQSINECLQKKARKENATGSTLPPELQLYCYELVESALLTGVALSKVDVMRPFHEKYGHRLTWRAHLSELIPAILHREKETLKEELQSVKEVSVIFDGTAHLGEALVIVVRFFHEDLYNLSQRLIRLQVLAKALKGEKLAQRLIFCLAVDYNFGSRVVFGEEGVRDGASVNGAAVRNVKFSYEDLFYVIRVSL